MTTPSPPAARPLRPALAARQVRPAHLSGDLPRLSLVFAALAGGAASGLGRRGWLSVRLGRFGSFGRPQRVFGCRGFGAGAVGRLPLPAAGRSTAFSWCRRRFRCRSSPGARELGVRPPPLHGIRSAAAFPLPSAAWRSTAASQAVALSPCSRAAAGSRPAAGLDRLALGRLDRHPQPGNGFRQPAADVLHLRSDHAAGLSILSRSCSAARLAFSTSAKIFSARSRASVTMPAASLIAFS